MWCTSCQSDVAAEVSSDSTRIHCAICGNDMGSTAAARISDKTKELKKRMAARKKHLESAKNLSANQNGIEGAMDLQVELKEDLRDMVDLSLMHLFNGDSKKAMQFLFQAKKMNNEHKE